MVYDDTIKDFLYDFTSVNTILYQYGIVFHSLTIENIKIMLYLIDKRKNMHVYIAEKHFNGRNSQNCDEYGQFPTGVLIKRCSGNIQRI